MEGAEGLQPLSGPGYLRVGREGSICRESEGGGGGGGRCSRVSLETHFVPRLCEKVTAREEYPAAPAAGRLRGELFLFKQEVAG